jgi:hypothetical protein
MQVESLFIAIDRAWRLVGTEKVPLRIFGAAALLLQATRIQCPKFGDPNFSFAHFYGVP